MERNNACPGTDSPAKERRGAPAFGKAMPGPGAGRTSPPNFSTLRFPRPTSISVPTIARTMFRRNLSAAIRKNQYCGICEVGAAPSTAAGKGPVCVPQGDPSTGIARPYDAFAGAAPTSPII